MSYSFKHIARLTYFNQSLPFLPRGDESLVPRLETSVASGTLCLAQEGLRTQLSELRYAILRKKRACAISVLHRFCDRRAGLPKIVNADTQSGHRLRYFLSRGGFPV